MNSVDAPSARLGSHVRKGSSSAAHRIPGPSDSNPPTLAPILEVTASDASNDPTVRLARVYEPSHDDETRKPDFRASDFQIG